jgi:hypothetical protein
MGDSINYTFQSLHCRDWDNINYLTLQCRHKRCERMEVESRQEEQSESERGLYIRDMVSSVVIA